MTNQYCHLYNEQELLVQVAGGDEKAFSCIMGKYTAFINTQLSGYVKDAMKAEEVSQDVFMSIWRHRDKLPALQNFPGFVYVITRNKVRQLKRKGMAMDELIEDRYPSPESGIEFKELTLILHKGIGLLPTKRREVFKMSRLEGLKNEEIAARLNLSKNTIREHIREALAFLRVWVPHCFADTAVSTA